jgi:hypothetical protein
MAENLKISGPGGVEAIMRQKQANAMLDKASKRMPIRSDMLQAMEQPVYQTPEEEENALRQALMAASEYVPSELKTAGKYLGKANPWKIIAESLLIGKPVEAATTYEKIPAYGGGTRANVRKKLIEAFQEADPAVQSLRKYFTKEELELMAPETVGKIQTLLQAQPMTAKEEPGEDPRILAGGSGMRSRELAAMAQAGKSKKGWYRASGNALDQVFESDSPRFTALLAALSPQTSVESNLENALNVWKGWVEAGRPTDEAEILRVMGDAIQKSPIERRNREQLKQLSKDLGLGEDGSKEELIEKIQIFQAESPQNAQRVNLKSVLGAWRPNSIRALTTPEGQPIQLSGPKVQSFSLNIQGNKDEVTNDTWEGKAVGVVQDVFSGSGRLFDTSLGREKLGYKSPGYLASSALHRKAADILKKATGQDWSAREIQETVWSFTKAVIEQRGEAGETRTIPEIIADTEAIDKRIAEVPDFATLLGTGRYAQILTEAGYGERLPELANIQGFGSEDPGSDPGSYGEQIIGTVGKRLEEQFRGDAVPRVFTNIRKKLRPAETGVSGRGAFTRGSGRAAANQLDSFSLPKETVQEFKSLGINAPETIVQLKPNKNGIASFTKAITEAANSTKYGKSVYVYSPEEYEQMKLFVTPDKKAGFAIKDDGDIVSVFNHKKSKYRGVGPVMMLLAVQEGGRKLDAFDTQLPHIYSKVGFKVAARLPWSDEEAPPGWSKEDFKRFNNGEPDVVFMYYEPDLRKTEVLTFGARQYDPNDEKRNATLFTDYMEAVAEQINKVEGQNAEVEEVTEDIELDPGEILESSEVPQ